MTGTVLAAVKMSCLTIPVEHNSLRCYFLLFCTSFIIQRSDCIRYCMDLYIKNTTQNSAFINVT